LNYSDKDSFFLDRLNTPWVERNGFPHWAMAMIWLVIVFLVSQFVVFLVATSILFATGAVTNVEELITAMNTRLDILFIGNSVGQIFILGLATFIIVSLHTGSETKKSFLRITWDQKTPFFMIMGAVLILVIQPAVMFLGYLNSMVPTPELLAEMQKDQYRMFEDFLTSEGVLLIGLFHIALVPAFAEEVLFRGYVLRAFEKSKGIIFALILSSFIFAAFHLQLTNLLPLATLGAIMGLLTWLSGSLWPAIVAHFVNNGAAVLMATIMPDRAFADITPDVLPPVWMLILSIVLSGIMVKILYHNSNYQLQS